MFGFVKRLFQKGAAAPVQLTAHKGLPLPRVPKLLSELKDDSRQVMIEMGNAVMFMDRDTYEYTYGNSTAPDPAQRDLDELLPRVNRVRAVAGGMSRGRATGQEIAFDTEDCQALAELRDILKIFEEPSTFDHCSCAGGPTLELFAGDDRIATIGIQHGHSIRWDRWKPDARLRDGQVLLEWLIKHGFHPEFLIASLHNQYDGSGLMPIGFHRGGEAPLTTAEQKVRVAELARAHGGDPQETLAVCQSVIDADPSVALAYAVRAQIRREQGDNAGCVADCSAAIQLDLPDAEVFFTRAIALDNLGRFDEALLDCDNAVKVNPAHAGAWNSRGLIHGRLQMFDQALADFAESVRIQPDWSLPYVNRGVAYFGRGDYQAAIADFERVIEQLGQSKRAEDVRMCGFAFWNLGRCREATGDRKRAQADYNEALRRCPELGASRK